MKNRVPFVQAVRQLCAVFGRQPSDDLLDGYWRALDDVDDEQFQVAVTSFLKAGKFMPAPAELRDAAEQRGGFTPSEYPEFK